MADIFVSYASEDRDRVRPLVALLENEGWSVWWDRELVVGPSFEAKIQEALDKAKCVVVAWSENSIKSNWCHDEANGGLESQRLVPVRVDDVRPPLEFRSLQTASLVGWPQERGETDQLIAGVRALLGAPPDGADETLPSAHSVAVLPFSNLSSGTEVGGLNFTKRLTVLIAVVWFIGATLIMLAHVGGNWDSKEVVAWLASGVSPPLLLVGWTWVKLRPDSSA